MAKGVSGLEYSLVPITLDDLTALVKGQLLGGQGTALAQQICIDSRMITPGAIFFALAGDHTDGHCFVKTAFANGASCAIVAADQIAELEPQSQWPLISVPSPLHALQQLANWFRHQYVDTVVAITGSNGKTIVKDTLVALVTQLDGQTVSASPGSYNSQLGLPLSVLSSKTPSTLAIYEVGISAPDEMARQRQTIEPNFAILTNIGMAHVAAFGSRQQIAAQKMQLFAELPADGWLLVPANEPLITPYLAQLRCKVYTFGADDPQLPRLEYLGTLAQGQTLKLIFPDQSQFTIRVHTRSQEIITDLLIAACAAFLLGVAAPTIASVLNDFHPLPTRMEIWRSPEGVTLINDAYSADPVSVRAALRATSQTASPQSRKIFVFGGMQELGALSEQEHRQIGALAAEYGFNQLLLVGQKNLAAVADGYSGKKADGVVTYVDDPQQLQTTMATLAKRGDVILFKGARNAGIDRAATAFSNAIAQRALCVDLAAVLENISRYRRHCQPGVQILAMIKALSYGTNLARLAYWMTNVGIKHIGVSSCAEGIEVRRLGVTQSVYVFLADENDIDNLIHYQLTPIVYSKALCTALIERLSQHPPSKKVDIHIKIDTGMHRVGFAPEDVETVIATLKAAPMLNLTGICTHFAAADDPSFDDFSHSQIATFDRCVAQIKAAGFGPLLVHAANSAAAARFPEAHYDMVRIGLGLYGLYGTPATQEALELQLAISVTSRITAINHYPAGHYLGYNRSYQTTSDTTVGIISFGYDDGLPRQLSNKGYVLVNGQQAPIVGLISMDQMQIDISAIPSAHIGTPVLIYGEQNGDVLRPELVAQWADSIPHELLIRLGKRVQRIYIEP